MNVWGSVGGEGVEKVGNGISRARVEDKMAGTLAAFGTGEGGNWWCAVGGIVWVN